MTPPSIPEMSAWGDDPPAIQPPQTWKRTDDLSGPEEIISRIFTAIIFCLVFGLIIWGAA